MDLKGILFAVLLTGFSTFAGVILTIFIERQRFKKECLQKERDAQKVLYQELWQSLIDLKDAADKLWQAATTANYMNFATQLDAVKKEFEGRRICIFNEEHIVKLRQIILVFENYLINKVPVVDFRKQHENNWEKFREILIEQIDNNERIRQQYTELIGEIEIQFREHIRL